MFFTPFLLSQPPSRPIFLLCLSTGDFGGLGKIRKKELDEAAAVLNINVTKCVDDKSLRDGQNVTWPSDVVKREVGVFISEIQNPSTASHHHGKSTPSPPPLYDSITIVTFDKHGVSGHTNHIQTYLGVKRFASSNPKFVTDANGNETPVSYSSLVSWRSPVLKYAPPLMLGICSLAKRRTETTSTYVLYSLVYAARAMVKHWSQLVW